MQTLNKRIAETILRAQNASDGGKRIDLLVGSRKAYRDNCAGYRAKDKFIRIALRMIAGNPGKTDFRFAVVYDKENVADFLVYFECRNHANGEKRQVSFHSFDASLSHYVRKSFRMKWDHADSRQSACDIYGWF